MTVGLLSRAAADMQWMSEETVSLRCVDGVTREVAAFGTGAPIVCVPVARGLNFLYAPQVRALRQEGRVVVYEPARNLGRGRLASVASARVAELGAVLGTIASGPVDLVGWSDGAIVAWRFATMFPGRVRSLSLLSLPRRYPAWLRLSGALLRCVPLGQSALKALAGRVLAHLSSGPVLTSEAVRLHVTTIPDFTNLLRYDLIPLMTDHDASRGTIAAPALVIVGDRDRFVSMRRAQQLVDSLPNARRLVVVPNGEHFLTYANAAAVNGALTAFMRRSAGIQVDVG